MRKAPVSGRFPVPPESDSRGDAVDASDRLSDGAVTVDGNHDPGGRFLPGNRAAVPGSRRGRRNRRTLSGLALLEELERGGDGLPPAEDRLRLLLTDPDPGIRLRVELWLFTMLHGVPPRRPLDPPSLVDSEEWIGLRTRLLGALEAHPEAIKAVREAIAPVRLSEPPEVIVSLKLPKTWEEKGETVPSP